jgi:pyridoxal phosphate enzyme (YggS family)
LRVSDEVLRYASAYPGAKVVAVTKTADIKAMRAAYEIGYTAFGENRIQDALAKIALISLPVEWHFIGRLQSNKARKAVGPFSLLHSLDNLRLANLVSNVSLESGVTTECLIQVNVSGEKSKQGIDPVEIYQFGTDIRGLQGIKVVGLMTMAPHEETPEATRPLFRKMRRLFEGLSGEASSHFEMKYLSMGMSNDYHVALDEGANLIRVGSAIFLHD